MLTYCVKQGQKTKCVPGSETHVVTKNGRNAMKCTCAEYGLTEFTFVPTQTELKGGALARRRNPSAVDKAAYVMSNFVTSDPSFAALGRVLAGQAFKGVKDSVDHYRKGRASGKGVDIHKPIGKLPKPKKVGCHLVITMPAHIIPFTNS